MKTILTIAGSDTCAGAGIQQDLKTVTSLGHYAVTVITAVTAQNTMGVKRIMPVPEEMLRAQLEAVLEDMNVAAVKTGMIPGTGAARVIIDVMRQLRVPLVCDPVMVSTSGTPLMSDECMEIVRDGLFPLCTLVTPNIPEAERLAGLPPDNAAAGRMLAERYGTAFLIKGGHGDGMMMTDRLYAADGTVREYSSPRIATGNLHGTGCTLSSAVASLLGEGLSLPDAVRGAKAVIDKGIEQGRSLHVGKGNGPLWVF
ncbi:MAG: bifunctional hydroxymethylpyrimidine kinase/phosphomethylpyrimidine kinase [Bacteroidales bacterium]|nr:bifunctional hydroxymethylpyrimidine kinase/phosphomethylpyrimidine kinase [Bacteroidales bacterium]MCM1146623.1 bifunctional hydroxymethylpyrimidine kinase/phosphomethylpyrimidine kinase [Bacteroidales bacterium]MCM1206015.1 bifunctional hydroxymethylpyrimidine kinase/phosphomethylpyrimidine kinase [Bacillota bacterium]MCM1511491.1 bifunctional hydroxymethylpyrimidine kinase/phosphomethylpyrimidine kinase [Clostridium sp.]